MNIVNKSFSMQCKIIFPLLLLLLSTLIKLIYLVENMGYQEAFTALHWTVKWLQGMYKAVLGTPALLPVSVCMIRINRQVFWLGLHAHLRQNYLTVLYPHGSRMRMLRQVKASRAPVSCLCCCPFISGFLICPLLACHFSEQWLLCLECV